MSYFNGKDEPENGFTLESLQADAAAKVAILRTIAAEFVDDDDDREPLTLNQQRLASRTPFAYLEKSAIVAEAAPDLAGTPKDAARILRLTHAADAAYGPLVAEAESLARQIRMAVLRKKLFAVQTARIIDRLARVFVQTGAGDWLRTHVEQMKRALTRPPRPKPEIDNPDPATATQ